MSSQDATPVTDGGASGGPGCSSHDHAHLDDRSAHSWDAPRCRDFHRGVADRIIAIANPKTTLDVGCGRGLLVQALAEKGVDSHGTDVSEQAVSEAHPEVRPRLEVTTGRITGRYDLISCLEVVEHLDPLTAQTTIDAMCAATDRVLFSSAPDGFEEPSHVNVHPTSDWAATFAERGFYRRTDLNLDFLGRDAVLFERSDLQPRDIVHRYETHLQPLSGELREKRRALLDLDRRLTSAREELRSATDPDGLRSERDRASQQHIANLELLLEKAKHDVLTTRDHIIGLEAETVRLQALVERLTTRVTSQQGRLQKLRTRSRNLERRVQRAEGKLEAVRASRAWRVGRMLTGSKSPKL